MRKKLLHTPEGVRDIYNSECEKKLELQNRLHKVIASYGYNDIQTPTFEFFDIFSREIGTTPSKELYKFFDREGNTLVLRPDITPSIARCVAKYYMDEKMPVRLSYLGNTFINNSEHQGKLKETTQLGAELINDDSPEADAEMIAMVIELLLEAGLTDFQIDIGNIDFFKSLVEETGMDEETELELRELISEKNYFGTDAILDNLAIEDNLKELLMKLPQLFGNMDVINEAKSLTSNPRAIVALERIERVYELIKVYGLEKYISIDLGMLSKYKYYTGIIFKAYTFGTGDAIVNGGRYDKLLGWFGKEAAAIGLCVMVDGLMSALTRQKKDITVNNNSVVVLYNRADFAKALDFAKRLRGANVKATLSLINDEISNYLEFAKSENIKCVYVVTNDAIEVNDMINNEKYEKSANDIVTDILM